MGRPWRILWLIPLGALLALQTAGTPTGAQLARLACFLADRAGLSLEVLPVRVLTSRYRTASPRSEGVLTSGQQAEIVLSSPGFGESGGGLAFLFPGNLTSDGRNLVLADTRNNRVLVWNRAPRGNDLPDLVLGQSDFQGNSAGVGLDRMNWPVGVATDGTRLVVADCWNDRLLVWNRMPQRSGVPADFELRALGGEGGGISMPYSVWTDGRVLALANRGRGNLMVWRGFPHSDRPADLVYSDSDNLGGVRYLAGDGRRLVVASYDAFQPARDHATFFWSSLPRPGAEDYDFFLQYPAWMHEARQARGALLRGAFGPQGQFVALSEEGLLYGWSAFPSGPGQEPDLFNGLDRWAYQSGDTTGLTYVGETLYISLMNGNRILGFGNLQSLRNQNPDYVVGARDVEANPLEERAILVNPNPLTDGRHLFVTSDFSQEMYVYRGIPDQSAAQPDLVYRFPEGPWDTALQGDRLVAVGGDRIWMWERLPLDGQPPDHQYRGHLGRVAFQDAKGVALDARGRLYLADERAGKVWVFASARPGFFEEPLATLEVDRPRRLSVSDRYLAVVCQSGYDLDGRTRVQFYPLRDLEHGARPRTLRSRLAGTSRAEPLADDPQDVLLAGERLFLANTFGNNVLSWKDVPTALDGHPPDLVLGQRWTSKRVVATRSSLVMPGALAFAGGRLWVGEYKFSQRLLRFDAGRD